MKRVNESKRTIFLNRLCRYLNCIKECKSLNGSKKKGDFIVCVPDCIFNVHLKICHFEGFLLYLVTEPFILAQISSIAFRPAWKARRLRTSCPPSYKRVRLECWFSLLLFILHKCKRVAFNRFPSGIATSCRVSH